MEATPLVLALPGPQYNYDYSGDEGTGGRLPALRIAGKPLRLLVEGNRGRGTGWSVWDGAPCLAIYLDLAASGLTQELGERRSVLELGSGTGLAGIAAAMSLRLPTVLTDLPEVLPSLSKNASLNEDVSSLITVQPLDWHTAAEDPDLMVPGGPFGLVIAADCVWLESLVEPFVSALRAVATDEGTVVIMAYQSRSTRVDDLLFGLLDSIFDKELIPLRDGEPGRGLIDLYRLRRRVQEP